MVWRSSFSSAKNLETDDKLLLTPEPQDRWENKRIFKKPCSDILENKRNIVRIIVDESTTLNQKTVLVIRSTAAAIVNNHEVIAFFLNIIEIQLLIIIKEKKAILIFNVWI